MKSVSLLKMKERNIQLKTIAFCEYLSCLQIKGLRLFLITHKYFIRKGLFEGLWSYYKADMILIHRDCLYISTVAFKRQKFESGPTTSKVLSSQWLAEGKCNSSSMLQCLLLHLWWQVALHEKQSTTFLFSGDHYVPQQVSGPGCFKFRFYFWRTGLWALTSSQFSLLKPLKKWSAFPPLTYIFLY